MKRVNVLVIDNEPMVLELFKLVIGMNYHDVDVRTTRDADEARRLIAAGDAPLDVVIADVATTTRGQHAALLVAVKERWPQAKTVSVSDDPRDLLKSTADHSLGKPCSEEAILQTVDACFELVPA